ncbi:RING-H2 finger protein ATL72 [Smittium culicis]|uniref:RING-type E3 ubiquitin transferase n=1 Tax=Smittium culicis TaxID=133412 RepID=A0A1R1Y9B5_9FUNG|nr:RING-H2 finger protein ATL72 [Smittium culicis]
MAPQFNIDSNIPTITLCFDCQISSFNPYTTSYYSDRYTTTYYNPTYICIILYTIHRLVSRHNNPTPVHINTHIQRPRPAPKERKNLNDDELALYPIVVVTEKMLESDNDFMEKYSKIIKKSKHIVDVTNDENDDGRPKMRKSASNVISNTFTQVKSGIFGSILNTSNEAGSKQEKKICIILYTIHRLVSRHNNPTPVHINTHIQRPRPAPKERKNLNDDELALYPIVVVTEKMLESDNDFMEKYSKIIKKSKHIVDVTNDENDDGRPKMLKSASNVISNTFTQVKSGIFGSILNTSNEAGSKQEKKSNSNECLICFEIIDVGDNIRIIPCLHKFHQECLDTWLTSRSGSCPNCRYDLRPHQENSTQENGDQDTGLPANPGLQPVAAAAPTNRQQNSVTEEQLSFIFGTSTINNHLFLNQSNAQTHNQHHMQSINNSDFTSSSHHNSDHNSHHVDNNLTSPANNGC